MGNIKSNIGEQIHCSPVCNKQDIMENTEKRMLELEPQSFESANKISSDIMDTATKTFGFILSLYTHEDFFQPTIVIAFYWLSLIFLFEEYHFLRLN